MFKNWRIIPHLSKKLLLNVIKEIQRLVEEIEQNTIEKPDGLFDVIVIDPPWGYIKQSHYGSFDAVGRRCTNPYPEMTQEELKKIELPASENCVLFL